MRHMSKVGLRAALMGAGSLLVLASPVAAQQATERQEPTVIDEIIVTAQKREQALNDVPMSITALSGEQLANRA